MTFHNPGSDEAHSLGCTCPKEANCNGKGVRNGISTDPLGNPMFIYDFDCPHHNTSYFKSKRMYNKKKYSSAFSKDKEQR